MQPKENKVINVAINFDDYLLKNSQVKQRSKIFKSQQRRMFLGETISPLILRELTNKKQYEIVGYKEVKSYGQKLKKLYRQNSKRQTASKGQKLKINHNDENSFLSKQELLSLQNRQSLKSEEESRIDLSSVTNTLDITKIKNSKAKDINNNKYSISKIKNTLQLYQNLWKRRLQTEGLQYCSKLPSIYDRVQLHRSIVEEKQLNRLIFEKKNINNKLWSSILREKIDLKDIHSNRYVTKILNNSQICSSGKSKLAAQANWVKEKSNEGFFFKPFKKTEHKFQ